MSRGYPLIGSTTIVFVQDILPIASYIDAVNIQHTYGFAKFPRGLLSSLCKHVLKDFLRSLSAVFVFYGCFKVANTINL